MSVCICRYLIVGFYLYLIPNCIPIKKISKLEIDERYIVGFIGSKLGFMDDKWGVRWI